MLEMKEISGEETYTGVVQEAPMDRSSREIGIKATAKVATEIRTGKVKKCMVLKSVEECGGNSDRFLLLRKQKARKGEANGDAGQRKQRLKPLLYCTTLKNPFTRSGFWRTLGPISETKRFSSECREPSTSQLPNIFY